jgi:tyrosyl-tRNA synthetase
LAEEITGRVHSPEAVKSIQKVSNILFNKKLDKTSLNDLSPEDYKLISKEIPCYTITQAATSGEVNIIDLMTETTDILKSKGEARRAISGNAISVNLEKISDIEYTVNADDFFHNKYMMLQNGKKNKYLIEIDG